MQTAYFNGEFLPREDVRECFPCADSFSGIASGGTQKSGSGESCSTHRGGFHAGQGSPVRRAHTGSCRMVDVLTSLRSAGGGSTSAGSGNISASPIRERLIERIERRGVVHEQRIDSNYLRQLSALYERFFLDYTETPLLIVNTAEINLADDSGEVNRLADRIREIDGGRHFFNPLVHG